MEKQHSEYFETLTTSVGEELLKLGISPKFSGYTHLQIGIAAYCTSRILERKVKFVAMFFLCCLLFFLRH